MFFPANLPWCVSIDLSTNYQPRQPHHRLASQALRAHCYSILLRGSSPWQIKYKWPKFGYQRHESTTLFWRKHYFLIDVIKCFEAIKWSVLWGIGVEQIYMFFYIFNLCIENDNNILVNKDCMNFHTEYFTIKKKLYSLSLPNELDFHLAKSS